MTFRVFCAIGCGVVCAMAAAAVWAAPQEPSAQGTAAAGVRSGATRAIASRSASIAVTALNADDSPIPRARLRLRNATTGRIDATTVANEAGQFVFTGFESGSYIVELVSESGKVLALSHTFSVAPGETVATVVRLRTKGPWVNGFFGSVAAAASSTAALVGVTAIAPEAIRPVSRTQ